MARAPSQYSATEKWYIQQLRKIASDWPPKTECINAARRGPDRYECAACKQLFRKSFIRADHIHPVIDPEKGYEGRGTYAARLFCDVSGLQALCTSCHQAKTNEENAIRRAVSKKRLQSASE